MLKSPLALVLVAVLLLGFVMPTGATSGDQLWTEPAVVAKPGDGPDGQYAGINEEGELVVDIAAPGVNADAVTVFRGVFSLTNTDEEPVALWFSHDEMDAVVLSVDGRSAQREADPIVLEPSEQATIDVTVDSSMHSAGERILSSVTINAENATVLESLAVNETAVTASAVNGTAGDPNSSVPPPTGEDEVVFADGVEPAAEFTTLDPATVTDLDARVGVDGPPRPVIDAALAPLSLDGDPVRSTDGADALIRFGESVTLSAYPTTFATTQAVQPDGHIARLVDIRVPADRADEPGVVRLGVERDWLKGADPTSARIGRHTPTGWQLLSTTVIEADDERVVLQAVSPGFGTFAVFPDPAADYRWGVPTDRTADRSVVTTGFDEPGRHEVSLTVADGLGRSATTEYWIIANDRPTVTIESPSTIVPGESVELRAAVTDEVGDLTITWQFDDGTTAVGPVVERSFTAGEHEVRVVVADEYGARATASVALAVGDAARASRAAIELVQLGVPLEERLLAVAVSILLVVVALRRWAAARPRRARGRRSR